MIRYLASHIAKGSYRGDPDLRDARFVHVNGWTDVSVCDSLIYSHRKTDYSTVDFDETAHFHDYYELVIYRSGNVDYVDGDRVLSPTPPSVIRFAPGEIHNTRLRASCPYERHVFYFRPSLFSLEGNSYPVAPFLFRTDAPHAFSIPPEHREEVEAILGELDALADAESPNRLLCLCVTLRLFALLDRLADKRDESESARALPERLRRIRTYIDTRYAEVDSITDLSEHFFYSREYVARLFRKYYNVTVSEYLTGVRIRRSVEKLESGASVTETAYAVGFKSASAFSLAFRKVMGISPSDYAKRKK